MSPAPASLMPATPVISTEPSPITSPRSSAASSASVRTLMRPSLGSVRASVSGSAPCGLGAQLGQHVTRQIERTVGVNDRSARGVEHQLEPLVVGDLLDRL